MIHLDDITPDYVLELVRTNTPEDDRVDFKSDWYAQNKKDEFAKDIAALANTSGGFIFLGIEEEDGKAVSIKGLDDPVDEQLRSLSQVAESTTRPRVPYRHRQLSVDGKTVIIFAVPKSRLAPHMLTGKCQFYKRLPVGRNEIMDPDDLRRVFQHSLSEDDVATTEFEIFKTSRPAPGPTSFAISFQAYPIAASSLVLEPSDYENHQVRDALMQLAFKLLRAPTGPRIAFDGKYYGDIGGNEQLSAMWNGIIKAHGVHEDRDGSSARFLPSVFLAEKIQHALELTQKVYALLGIDSEVIYSLQLSGCHHRLLTVSWVSDAVPVDRDVLRFPNLRFPCNAPTIFRDSKIWLDLIWRAAGQHECPILDPKTGEPDIRRLER